MMMNINEVIELKYKDLHKLCKKNYVRRIERQATNNDFEDEDILQTLILKWLKKFKNTNFANIEEGYEVIYTEFTAYSKFQLMKSEQCLVHLSFYEYFIEQKNRLY